MKLFFTVLTAFVTLSSVGCRSTYYKIWEKLGKEKRDLLLTQVADVKDQQKGNAEHFKDALTRLQEAYGKSGTKLEAVYDRLKSDDERARAEAEALDRRITRMNTTAGDLFREWEKEIGEFTNHEFAAKSRANFRRTRSRFQALSDALEKSAARTKPVLARLHETTLFLKHNLNAQSLGTMKGEGKAIERSLEGLLEQMNISIREADDFLATLKNDDEAA